jgi:hypothetical protein
LERSFLIVVWICVGSAFAAPAAAQTGFDRPGGDYANFTVESGDPIACATACDQDPRCRAWNFAYPTTQRRQAVCWLKNRVPAPVAASCCVSGVRGAALVEPQAGAVEFSVDRFGGDYRNLEVSTDTAGKSCADACQGDNKCRAWTYVRPGYIGSSARCYLKNRVTAPRRSPCCISGVVR